MNFFSQPLSLNSYFLRLMITCHIFMGTHAWRHIHYHYHCYHVIALMLRMQILEMTGTQWLHPPGVDHVSASLAPSP